MKSELLMGLEASRGQRSFAKADHMNTHTYQHEHQHGSARSRSNGDFSRPSLDTRYHITSTNYRGNSERDRVLLAAPTIANYTRARGRKQTIATQRCTPNQQPMKGSPTPTRVQIENKATRSFGKYQSSKFRMPSFSSPSSAHIRVSAKVLEIRHG